MADISSYLMVVRVIRVEQCRQLLGSLFFLLEEREEKKKHHCIRKHNRTHCL